MYPNAEALEAFVEAAAAGSFSAAARTLGKRQSSISESIARLEDELGVVLFDRQGRYPVLTVAGGQLLDQARAVLSAHDRLANRATQLAAGVEPRLTLVISDTYQPTRYEALLVELDQRYPDLEFECLIAEDADVLSLVQGRADLGLLAAQPPYPADIEFATLDGLVALGLYVATKHPLAGRQGLTQADLAPYRLLRLSTVTEAPSQPCRLPDTRGRCWSAPDYLLLLDMAVQGFGWAELPHWVVAGFGQERLVELAVPGWPQRVAVDVVWSRRRPLGPAGNWLRERLLRPN
ncbi:transcriptional regulator [Pseudomonas oryzihabitans]|nr:transcriptional regulator [Pseudomonas psychrotolerans]KTT77943.1 transcriptional regulator [Pseudomonas psychrotolerans]